MSLKDKNTFNYWGKKDESNRVDPKIFSSLKSRMGMESFIPSNDFF
jgi:nucleoside-specific outer membrane channel protein Tsx